MGLNNAGLDICNMMIPCNLCKCRLHNFKVWKTQGKLRHVFQISHRISLGIREGQLHIGGKIFDKLAAPSLMLVDTLTDVVVQSDQFLVDLQRCRVLCVPDLLLDALHKIQIFAIVQKHPDPVTSHKTVTVQK